MEKKKIVIVGGGVAGLSAGIFARLNGFESQIVEMHSIAGGLCTAWFRKGYKFDYSVQWIVGTRCGTFYNTYRQTNILNDEVEILNADFHTRIVNGSEDDFLMYTDIEKWKAYLLEKAPEDAKKIKKMCRDIKRCCYLEPFDLAPSLRKPWHYIRALVRSYPALYTIFKNRNNTCEDYFSQLDFKNKWLQTSLHNLHRKANFSSVAFLLVLAWYIRKNAGYPVGGSLAIVQRMQQRYESLGGTMLFKKKVKEILLENHTAKGVLLEDGTQINADYVISAADGYNTIFKMLKGDYVSKKIHHVYQHWETFVSFVQVSFGIHAPLKTDYPVQLVLAEGRQIGRTRLSLGYRILNYSFDPTMAAEGKTCIVIRFESPWELWQDLSKEEYQQEKKAIEKEAVRILEENYPDSAAHIDVCDIATPQTTVNYTGAWKGSYEGFLPSSKNITQQLSQTLSGIDNFYMAGHWLFPGGGIPPSVQSGKWAIQMICRKEKQKFVTEQNSDQ
ncbi:MAG: NAD(P)/FAD-dependent oxidoreductase [Bacteroidales bacterium]|jgi:phytoene dehydrogenase-like protein|nr:NAD(P)/FAD-dependent oxidoreductase [Bacteroidales bacterium]